MMQELNWQVLSLFTQMGGVKPDYDELFGSFVQKPHAFQYLNKNMNFLFRPVLLSAHLKLRYTAVSCVNI